MTSETGRPQTACPAMNLQRQIVLSLGLILFAAGLLYLSGCLWNEKIFSWLSAACCLAALVCYILSRSLGFNFVVVFLSISASLLAGDLIIRLFFPYLIFYRDHEFLARPDREYAGMFVYPPNARFEHDTFGDLAALSGCSECREMRHVVFTTDEYGFRNPAGMKGPFDVILLGDSFGLGNGVTDGRTVADILRRKGLKVYNLSTPGGPWQQAIAFQRNIERLNSPGAVLIWMLFGGNDLDDTYGETADLSRLKPLGFFESLQVRLNAFRRNSPVRQLIKRWRGDGGAGGKILEKTLPYGRRMLFFKDYADLAALSRQEVVTDPNLKRLEACLDAAGRKAAQVGIEVVLVNLPSKEQIYDGLFGPQSFPPFVRFFGFSETLASLAYVKKYRFFDFYPALRPKAQKLFGEKAEAIFWLDDTHWNETGQVVVGDALYKYLMSSFGTMASVSQP